MQFQHDLPKNKKLTALLLFFPKNLEKYRQTELYDAPLEGSTIFLYRSSTSDPSLDSSGLAELKYAFFCRTGRNTKKLRRSDLFQLTIFKHRLLEGSTILLLYSSISRTMSESSRLGEFKCAISAGYDVILKNKSIRKCKKDDIVRLTYMVTVVWATTGIDIFFSTQLLKPCTVGQLLVS